jgi:uncharacterized membrane protein
MNSKTIKEILIAVLAIAPVAYLAMLWGQLPETVPVHFDINGQPDRYGSRRTLIWLSVGMPLFLYGLMWILPKIDPKKKLELMGEKYTDIRLILSAFFAILLIIIIRSAQANSIFSGSELSIVIGGLFIVLGNYLKTIRPNYMLGIRTPWTLEDERVWKDTHRLGGYVFMAGGILVCLAGLLLSAKVSFIAMMIVVGTTTLIPLVYSYIRFQELKKQSQDNKSGQ